MPIPADNLFMDLRYMRGFIQIQNLLERALMNTISDIKGTSRMNDNKKFPVVYLQQFPYPKYKSEEFVFVIFLLDFYDLFLFFIKLLQQLNFIYQLLYTPDCSYFNVER